MIRALIVDDEKPARLRLARLLHGYDDVRIIGEASSGLEALELIQRENPDLVFLDIRMPGLTGFDVLEKLEKSPYVVFTTAFDRYALRAFEENAVDYLLKPIGEKELSRAVEKMHRIMNSSGSFSGDIPGLIKKLVRDRTYLKRISVSSGDRIRIFPAERIHFFLAEDKFTFLAEKDGRHIVSFTLKELECKLDPERFVRVHRNCIVNLEMVASVHRWFGGRLLLKMKNGKEITVSRNHASRFREKINL